MHLKDVGSKIVEIVLSAVLSKGKEAETIVYIEAVFGPYVSCLKVLSAPRDTSTVLFLKRDTSTVLFLKLLKVIVACMSHHIWGLYTKVGKDMFLLTQ